MDPSPGARLANLLLGGFTALADEVHDELALLGHPGVRATHEFALVAIDQGAATATALGRRLGVSKQAAAKTIAALEQLGYLDRVADPVDARSKRLQVTDRGREMSTIGAAVFDRLRAEWAATLQPGELDVTESALTRLIDRRGRR